MGLFRPVSASFVSAERGWVLETNAAQCDLAQQTCALRVLDTVDGGLTWSVLTIVRHAGLGSEPKIRFADAMHGFIFTGTFIVATQDGGAHWWALTVPFQGVQTLEIAHGVVYVVGWDNHDVNEFRVWSTRADDLRWSMDPLSLPLGAGPVPVQQLVFAAGSGWLLNSDRSVMGGDRLTTARHWAPWTPPCLNVAGPADLAASTPTDLMALCWEHVWSGGPVTPALYVSHDGGASFRRRSAPSWGTLSTPNPATAVIATGQTLRRTTDDGTTWHVVAQPNPQGDTVLELGFTTTTQGFVILGVAGMFLTRDSGATWSLVRGLT